MTRTTSTSRVGTGRTPTPATPTSPPHQPPHPHIHQETSMSSKLLFTATSLIVSTIAFTRVASAECHDLTVGGETFEQFCKKNGYSYTYEKRNTNWAVAGQATIAQDYKPIVKKTDPLTVTACKL